MVIKLGSGPSDLLNLIGNGSGTLHFLSKPRIIANTLLPMLNVSFNLLDWSGLLLRPFLPATSARA